MNYDSIEFDIVNIGLGVQRTNDEVVKIVENLTKTKLKYTIADGKVYDSMNWVCDPTHLKTKYGYECKTSLEEGLAKYYDWLKNSLMLSHT
jgi:nucleoside-diphosphate-sugar epimerase